ncbi:ABC transporter substrate-binding protein [Sutcliffiella horikoshii]|uniref:ABC transporter substrate-binding protein n=1 Tax=Sutcliffiella horikoshii TaxID=79883 RepID=A0AA94WNX0_9BACI|nr:ABC transporter substrate-binding protein [Sutcliffiella horikoshii]TYS54449.1 ABC transporter substrate-binding protein [Sutcliffiella horikoshii]
MKTKNRYTIIHVFIAVMLLLVAGCSQTEKNTVENQATNSTEGNSSKTRVIEHSLGETEIPENPERIFVTLQRIADPMLALGIKPHAISAYGDLSYLDGQLNEVKVFDEYPLNVEAILAEAPDLIVADPWTDQERYEQLSKIAPTVVIDGNDWREFFPNVAEVFGKEKEYKQWMEAYKKKADEAKAQLEKELKDETVMILRVQQDFIGVWSGSGGASAVLFEDLGLTPHEKVTNDWNELSLEALPDFDADHIFLEVRSTAEGSQKYFDDNMKDSSIWNNMKAVKNGNVYPVSSDVWVEGDGPIGRDQIIDQVLEDLTGN